MASSAGRTSAGPPRTRCGRRCRAVTSRLRETVVVGDHRRAAARSRTVRHRSPAGTCRPPGVSMSRSLHAVHVETRVRRRPRPRRRRSSALVQAARPVGRRSASPAPRRTSPGRRPYRCAAGQVDLDLDGRLHGGAARRWATTPGTVRSRPAHLVPPAAEHVRGPGRTPARRGRAGAAARRRRPGRCGVGQRRWLRQARIAGHHPRDRRPWRPRSRRRRRMVTHSSPEFTSTDLVGGDRPPDVGARRSRRPGWPAARRRHVAVIRFISCSEVPGGGPAGPAGLRSWGTGSAGVPSRCGTTVQVSAARTASTPAPARPRHVAGRRAGATALRPIAAVRPGHAGARGAVAAAGQRAPG